ncbi:VOC family protein [Ekhidna sp.]|uniref:VOC family protein n=1 Tax=Ekhidna sp. TaxID=2608089 RepID=UPI003CCB7982
MNKPTITGMTIAVTEMDKMVTFYSQVLQLTFEELEMYGSKLFKTRIGQIEVLFCPAEIAQNTAKQNRHQLDFEISNLNETISTVEKYHGSIMGEPTQDSNHIQVGIKDPDNNSLVIKQRLEN